MIYKIFSIKYTDVQDYEDVVGMHEYANLLENAGFILCGSVEQSSEDFNISFKLDMAALADLTRFIKVIGSPVIVRESGITIYDDYM